MRFSMAHKIRKFKMLMDQQIYVLLLSIFINLIADSSREIKTKTKTKEFARIFGDVEPAVEFLGTKSLNFRTCNRQ